MSNIFASGNGLTLIGVAVLAVATVIVAVWTARTSGRVAELRAHAEALEKRLSHVEEYLASSSRMAPARDDEPEEDEEPVRRSSGRARNGSGSRTGNRDRDRDRGDRQASKARRSKRDMVVPSGTAKAAKPAARPAARTPQPRAEDPFASRQSMSHDARRRREERHQAQMRQRAQAIVQEHNRQHGAGSETEEL